MPFTTLIIEAAPESLRGAVSRFLFKVGPVTYVGQLSHRIRQELWKLIEETIEGRPEARALIMWADTSEQGFATMRCGLSGRYLAIDLDGLTLVGMEAAVLSTQAE